MSNWKSVMHIEGQLSYAEYQRMAAETSSMRELARAISEYLDDTGFVTLDGVTYIAGEAQ